jgi:hypothetical protein
MTVEFHAELVAGLDRLGVPNFCWSDGGHTSQGQPLVTGVVEPNVQPVTASAMWRSKTWAIDSGTQSVNGANFIRKRV